MIWKDILFLYTAPFLGCIMSAAMFAAPVKDLRKALLCGCLGMLNPFPWAIMTGNCVGWCAYGYYKHDPFILASNLPGLILSFWLNSGASKLQYLEMQENRKLQAMQGSDVPVTASSGELFPNEQGFQTNNPQQLVMVPQELLMIQMLCAWAAILVWVGWIHPVNQAMIIGVIVNINLVFFYGAPLQAIQIILHNENSDCIHVPTMVMNWINTSFWMMYGCAIRDFVIILPNAMGLGLGIAQGMFCLAYPKSSNTIPQLGAVSNEPILPDNDSDNNNSEEQSTRPDGYTPPQQSGTLV